MTGENEREAALLVVNTSFANAADFGHPSEGTPKAKKSPVGLSVGIGGHPSGNCGKAADDAKLYPLPVDKGVEIENSGEVHVFFRFHWLTFTVHENWEKAREMVIYRLLNLSDVLPDEFFKLGENGSRGYQKVWIGEDAIRIYFEPADGSKRYTVEIPGEVMEKHLTWGTMQSVFQELSLQKIKWKCTRLDLAFDMPKGSRLTPSGINSYLRFGGSIRCPAERKTIMFISPTFSDIQEDVNGATLYIGSRTSQRFIRIYDKRGFTRLEMEVKKKQANTIFRQFVNSEIQEWLGIAKSQLLDYLDLPDHTEWKEFTNGVLRPAKIEQDIVTKKFEQTKEWIEKSVAPSLAMINEIYGKNGIDELVKNGKKRISLRQSMMIENERSKQKLAGVHNGKKTIEEKMIEYFNQKALQAER